MIKNACIHEKSEVAPIEDEMWRLVPRCKGDQWACHSG